MVGGIPLPAVKTADSLIRKWRCDDVVRDWVMRLVTLMDVGDIYYFHFFEVKYLEPVVGGSKHFTALFGGQFGSGSNVPSSQARFSFTDQMGFASSFSLLPSNGHLSVNNFLRDLQSWSTEGRR